MTYPQLIARDLLAAMTDDEAAAFVTEARTPRNDLDPTDATEAAERAFARNLFAPEADDAEPDEHDDTTDTTGTDETDEHKPPVGNFVPREGNIPQSRDDTDAQFIRDLFNLN